MMPSVGLPIHFLSIVLNGEPFIRYHIDMLRRLPFRWHWHLVEGMAALHHDTAWAAEFGGQVPESAHLNGLSTDGTSAYLDELAACFPEQISLYRPEKGRLWDGKREMVTAPLSCINEDCLLWQLDVDEFWTTEQVCRSRELFLAHPERTAAWYYCHFYVGPNLVVIDNERSQHRLNANWLRTWRYTPGCHWEAHEPPILVSPNDDGRVVDLGQQSPFTSDETRRSGLVFQHKAYVLVKQLHFKEHYYGYRGATMNWLLLQKQSHFPQALRNYFPWPFVGIDTFVAPDVALSIKTIPLPNQGAAMQEIPRDMNKLHDFLNRVAEDVYPEPPSSLHAEITCRALMKLHELFALKPGMKVLDVGCGQGPALEYFRGHGTDYLGITLGDEDIVACQAQGFHVEKMDQSFLKLSDESQDVVWARHVIEHSIFPLFTLHGFNRVLRHGGMLYLEVPAPETSCHHERNPNHYSLFGKGCWRALIERSGFKILGDVDYSFEVPAGPDLYWGFYCQKKCGS
jgi:SAM-dependent methyltransferase